MSLLIKGMDMPKEGCKDCLLVKRGQVFDICPFLKREVNGNVERGGKPYDCPLVPVLPHGRLIDADAIEYTHAIARCIEDGHNWNELCVTADEICDMPTIIEAEKGAEEC